MVKKNRTKISAIKSNSRRAVFLDRDGTINYDFGYVHKFSNFKFRPHVIKGLKYLTKKNYLIFIVTNQAGIGKGIFKISDFVKLNKQIIKYLKKKDVLISGVEFCPYHPKAKIKKYRKKTQFRKPGNYMIKKILNEWKININKSFMLGDQISDKTAAKKSKIYFEYVSNNFYKQIKKIDNKISNNY